MDDMCGRVIQASPPDQLGLKIIDALDPRDNRLTGDPFGNAPPRYNGAPSQQLWVIRQTPQTGERSHFGSGVAASGDALAGASATQFFAGASRVEAACTSSRREQFSIAPSLHYRKIERHLEY